MKDILLNIGAIIEVEHDYVSENYIIIAKRSINFGTMTPWDYYCVPYPEGGKKTKNGEDKNGFYCNHEDIDKILYKAPFRDFNKNIVNK